MVMWSHKKGAGSSPKALTIGRKLLSALRGRLDTGGISSGKDRQVLDDGTIVEVFWHVGVPTIKIFPAVGGSEFACELYVESGMLDLGADISGTAAHRFDYGRPVFSSDPATLYFNTTACTPAGGANGAIKLTEKNNIRSILSQCLNGPGTSVTSRLSDPDKKQAQAVLPASCWSGLMRRYVASLYGSAKATYTLAADNSLDTPVNISPNCYVNCYGLVYVSGKFVFVKPTRSNTGVTFDFYSATFGDCERRVFDLWLSKSKTLLESVIAGDILTAPETATYEANLKILSIALSGCTIGAVINSVFVATASSDYVSTNSMSYGFDRAAATLQKSGGQRYVAEFLFSYNSGTGEYGATLSAGADGALLPVNFSCALYTQPISGMPYAQRAVSNTATQSGSTVTTPVHAYYKQDTNDLRVISYSVTLGTQALIEPVFGNCNPYDTSPKMYVYTSAPAASAASFVQAAQSLTMTLYPLGDNSQSYTSGFVETSSAGVEWSTVSLRSALTVTDAAPNAGAKTTSVSYNAIANPVVSFETHARYVGAIVDYSGTGTSSIRIGQGPTALSARNLTCVSFPSVSGSSPLIAADNASALAGITAVTSAVESTTLPNDSFAKLTFDTTSMTGDYTRGVYECLSITMGDCQRFYVHDYSLLGIHNGRYSSHTTDFYVPVTETHVFDTVEDSSVPITLTGVSLVWTLIPGTRSTFFTSFNSGYHVSRSYTHYGSGGGPPTINYSSIPLWNIRRQAQSLVVHDIEAATDWTALTGKYLAAMTVHTNTGGPYPWVSQISPYMPPTPTEGVTFYNSTIGLAGTHGPINSAYTAAEFANDRLFYTTTGLHLTAKKALTSGTVIPNAYSGNTGRSINSDRHTFTGGYPAVNNPSFIGWA